MEDELNIKHLLELLNIEHNRKRKALIKLSDYIKNLDTLDDFSLSELLTCIINLPLELLDDEFDEDFDNFLDFLINQVESNNINKNYLKDYLIRIYSKIMIKESIQHKSIIQNIFSYDLTGTYNKIENTIIEIKKQQNQEIDKIVKKKIVEYFEQKK